MSDQLHDLLSNKSRSALFVGIGNILKRDDGVGVYISHRIKATDLILTLTVETGIENYIGKINSLNPDLLCQNQHNQ